MRKPATQLDIKKALDSFASDPMLATRGSALLRFAWLDDALMSFVQSRLLVHADAARFLFSGSGPLHFSKPRIHLAFMAGWISEDVFTELETLREIRNQFGHLRDPLTFADTKIASLCATLRIPAALQKDLKHPLEGGPEAAYQFSCLILDRHAHRARRCSSPSFGSCFAKDRPYDPYLWVVRSAVEGSFRVLRSSRQDRPEEGAAKKQPVAKGMDDGKDQSCFSANRETDPNLSTASSTSSGWSSSYRCRRPCPCTTSGTYPRASGRSSSP